VGVIPTTHHWDSEKEARQRSEIRRLFARYRKEASGAWPAPERTTERFVAGVRRLQPSRVQRPAASK